ncbi:conserved hypothetical protein [gamma proteobacterium HTCC5015]|nr:conserved hypothetical protein [gamma proteobacterium HTCC5015]
MHNTAEALLQAHVAFELERLTGDQLESDIGDIVQHFLNSELQAPLDQWVEPEQVSATLARCVLELPLDAQFGELIGSIAEHLYQLKDSDQTQLSHLIPRKDAQRWVKESLAMKELRETLIHKGMRSTIYRELVADILYAGISSYLTEANAISKNVPGAKKMMAMGKGWINKAAPKLEERVATQVKKSINANLSEVIEHGEAFITESISEAHLNDIAMNIWDSIAEHPIALIRDYLGAEDIQTFVHLGYEQWLDLRGNDYIKALVEAGVTAFFERYGSAPLATLCQELGLDAKRITAECLNYAPKVIHQLHNSGFLEAWLRERLGAFYASSAAQKVLEG